MEVNEFQSTLPTRGSDEITAANNPSTIYFNPRSPRGGATLYTSTYSSTQRISIHAPHEGERLYMSELAYAIGRFQSTLPTRGSDLQASPFAFICKISIHAPHEGERLAEPYGISGPTLQFQSTLPTRGSDIGRGRASYRLCDFNPRSPRGGATIQCGAKGHARDISIHAPHEGERPCQDVRSCPHRNFNPRSQRGGATLDLSTYPVMQYDFNPRSPRGGATRC